MIIGLTFALRIGVLATLLVPFVFANTMSFPFITGKMFTFRILVEFLIGGYLVLAMFEKKYRPRGGPLLYAVCFWLIVLMLSTIFGVDAARSFWGNHERMLGVFSILHYGALMLIAAHIFRDRKDWDQLLAVALVIAAIMAVLAFYERWSPGLAFLNPNKMRVWTTLGNSIYLGNYMLFHFFFALLLFVRRIHRPFYATFRRPVPLLLMGTMILSFVVLLMAGSRGETVGLGIGLLGVAAIAAFRLKRYRAPTIGILGIFVALSAIIFVFKPPAVINAIPSATIRKVFSLSLREGGAVSTRYIAWGIALDAFRERPILGYGQENFYIAFNRHFRPESLRYGFYETWFDRSHNAVLDSLAMTGTLGFLTWLGTFGAAVFALVRSARRRLLTFGEAAVVSMLLVAHFTQNIFVFESITSFLFLFIAFAWIHARTTPLPDDSKDGKALAFLPIVHGSAILMLAVGTLVLVYTTNVQAIRANRAALQGSALFNVAHQPIAGAEQYLRALEIPTPHRVEIRTDFGRDTGMAMEKQDLDRATATKLWELAAPVMRANLNERRDAYDFIQFGQVAASYARFDSSVLPEAAAALQKATELTPRRQQSYYALAKVFLMMDKQDEAISALKTAVSFDELVPDSHWYLALTLIATGRDAEAATELERAIDHGYSWKAIGEVAYAAEFLRLKGNATRAPALYERGIQLFGEQAELYARLAESYAQINERDKARAAAARAVEIDPSLKTRLQNILK